MATCNVNTLLASGKDFQSLSKKELQIVICQLLCNIVSSGGSGGVGAVYGPTTGVFVGGVPTVVPTADGAIAYDSSGTIFTYYSGAWH